MTARSITLMLLTTSALTIACDGGMEFVQPLPDPPGFVPQVLTTLEVSPKDITLEQGWTVQLQVLARDQRGSPMSDRGGLTFSTSDPAIAKVSENGLVTGIAGGVADIAVTKTLGGVTLNAGMKATILDATPLPELVVTADLQHGWQPPVAHLIAGGTVKWMTAGPRSWSDVPHVMLYLLDENYSIVDSLDLRPGSATIKLERSGEYRYCSAGCWDPPDFGVIYVH